MEEKVAFFRARFDALRESLQEVIVGHARAIEILLSAFFSEGHVLIEGVPGLGKTLLSASFAKAVGLSYKKIQFTPDLMPADITGTYVIVEKEGNRVFEFREGPLFANIVLADEINRATPKTQSALLEAMQERFVSAGKETFMLPRPFMVLATQNPVEMRGTYPLPEAQKDRFMFKVRMEPSDEGEMAEILERTTGSSPPEARRVMNAEDVARMMEIVREVVVPEHVRVLVARILLRTDPRCDDGPEIVKKYVRLGASIRGGQALVAGAKVKALLDGRVNVTSEGVLSFVEPALRHRLILTFEAGADGVSAEDVLREVVRSVEA